jgi:GTPase SAR1 family protein
LAAAAAAALLRLWWGGMQIWDSAGQERFTPIAAQYFRGSQGIVV